MKLQDFFYPLPGHLIAQHPLKKRDQARLMVINRGKGTIHHDIFCNLNKYLPPQSLIVLNDSKVIPARLMGRKEKTGGRVEVFLLQRLADGCHYATLMRPLRRIKEQDRIIFNGGKVVAEVVDKEERIVRFNKKNIAGFLEKCGHMPLPPYIKREDTTADRKYYQTVFARHAGSVAAPTAGLHFTKRLLNSLQRSGHSVCHVTLHINYATFKPVEEVDITKHKMHEEEYQISSTAWQKVREAKKNGRAIVAVGTTSCRVLETATQRKQGEGRTGLFIYPGFSFQAADILLTNFHLPYSSLLMLVCAFASRELILRAYAEAVKERYRFFSYGDAMLIL